MQRGSREQTKAVKKNTGSLYQGIQAGDISHQFNLCSSISFLFLSYIPSFYHGNNAYDSDLRFSRFESDYRFEILMLTMATRSILIYLRKVRFSLLDAFNIGVLAYALGFFALVGFRSSNDMALPVQLIAALNLIML